MFGKPKLIIHSMLSKETQIFGNLTFEGGMHLDAQVNGNISCSKSNATLFIGKSGLVKGQIEVDNIIIEGTVTGNITASKQLTIKQNGKVVGDVFYGKIKMEEGAQIQGKLVLLEDSAPTEKQSTLCVPEPQKNTAQPVIPKKETNVTFMQKNATALNKT